MTKHLEETTCLCQCKKLIKKIKNRYKIKKKVNQLLPITKKLKNLEFTLEYKKGANKLALIFLLCILAKKTILLKLYSKHQILGCF